MTERRQRPIPVTREERAHLDEHKRRFENATGSSGDWGAFLRTITLIGLGALGIYGFARAVKRSTESATILCPGCGANFAVSIQSPQPRVVEVVCPNCNAELVADLGTWELTSPPGQQLFTTWEGICPNCGSREAIQFITRPPYWREEVPVKCSECGSEYVLRE